MKVIEYEVVSSNELNDFLKEVNAFTSRGWMPNGPISTCRVNEDNFSDDIQFTQSLTRWVDVPDSAWG